MTILGHQLAAEILEKAPNQIDVIFISNPDEIYAINGSDKIESLAKECCTLLFHDITTQCKKKTSPQMEDVRKALDFAKGRCELLITCQAGISRSSAIAYLAAAQEVGSVEALNILNPNIHIPNSLIIKHGSSVLNEPNIVNLIDRWKIKNKVAKF